MGKALAGLFSGALFGVGLAVSGMAQPAKVIGFLDVAGAWDPSLAMVMGGAIAVFAPAYQYLVRNTVPVFMQEFIVHAGNRIDTPLVVGSGIFGVGWGMAGYCPGPGLIAAGTGAKEALLFSVSMIAGMVLFSVYQRLMNSRQVAAAEAEATQ